MLGRIARSQRGAFMVFFAILVPFFLGMIGFAVDAGFVYMQKAKMQDIADAAALAGAARLNDGSDVREGYVTSAVKAYADANGMKTTATNVLNLDQEGSMAPTKNTFQIAQGILTSVMDKDNVPRDHVRVVIAKRVPTFFIGLLLPEEKEGVLVKAAAEAEYVEGEEAPVESEGYPSIITYNGGLQFHNTNVYGKNGKGLYSDIYLRGGDVSTNGSKLDLYASYYAWAPSNAIELKGDKEKNIFKSLSSASSDANYKYKEDVDKTTAKVEKLYNSCRTTINSINVDDFKQGKNNKVYIDRFGIYPQGVQIDSEKEYDVYIDATNMTMNPNNDQWGDYRSIVSNRYLHGIQKIKNLFLYSSNGFGILNTKNIVVENVYCLQAFDIEGEKNYFNGVIFRDNGTIRAKGSENHYGNLLANSIEIGKGWNLDELGNGSEGVADSNWKCYFGGSSSGSSGSSGSDTGTSAHVRLVK